MAKKEKKRGSRTKRQRSNVLGKKPRRPESSKRNDKSKKSVSRVSNTKARRTSSSNPKRSNRKNPKRVKAGIKGWVTRRRNARKEVSGWMWRVTVAAPYTVRCKHAKRNEYLAASYMVRGWFKTENEARKAVPKLKKLAELGREKAMARAHAAWNPEELNVEVKQVPYDERFLSIIEEKDEDPCQ